MRMATHNMRRQRGTAFVLVLAITTLLVTLGVTVSQIARVELQANTLEQDQAKARIAAHYALDVIHKSLDGDTAWRDSATTNAWRYFGNFDGVNIFYAYIDQIDGDVSDDATQPLMLQALAISGRSIRAYRIELIPDDAGNLRRNDSTYEQGVFY